MVSVTRNVGRNLFDCRTWDSYKVYAIIATGFFVCQIARRCVIGLLGLLSLVSVFVFSILGITVAVASVAVLVAAVIAGNSIVEFCGGGQNGTTFGCSVISGRFVDHAHFWRCGSGRGGGKSSGNASLDITVGCRHIVSAEPGFYRVVRKPSGFIKRGQDLGAKQLPMGCLGNDCNRMKPLSSSLRSKPKLFSWSSSERIETICAATGVPSSQCVTIRRSKVICIASSLFAFSYSLSSQSMISLAVGFTVLLIRMLTTSCICPVSSVANTVPTAFLCSMPQVRIVRARASQQSLRCGRLRQLRWVRVVRQSC